MSRFVGVLTVLALFIADSNMGHTCSSPECVQMLFGSDRTDPDSGFEAARPRFLLPVSNLVVDDDQTVCFNVLCGRQYCPDMKAAAGQDGARDGRAMMKVAVQVFRTHQSWWRSTLETDVTEVISLRQNLGPGLTMACCLFRPDQPGAKVFGSYRAVLTSLPADVDPNTAAYNSSQPWDTRTLTVVPRASTESLAPELVVGIHVEHDACIAVVLKGKVLISVELERMFNSRCMRTSLHS